MNNNITIIAIFSILALINAYAAFDNFSQGNYWRSYFSALVTILCFAFLTIEIFQL